MIDFAAIARPRAILPRVSLAARCLAVAVLLALPGCDRGGGEKKSKSGPRPPLPVRAVTVATVVEHPMERVITAVGSLLALDGAVLAAKVPGRLESISVDLGSVVKQGQVIARIEQRDFELRLRQAGALLAQARVRLGLPVEGDDDRVDLDKANLVTQAKAVLDEAASSRERIAALRQKGILPQSELDAVESVWQVAASRHREAMEEVRARIALLAQRRVEVEIARQQLADSTLLAPYDAVVQERHASAGEFLETGRRVVTVVRVNPLRLRLEIPEREAADVRAGQTVRAELEGGRAAPPGVITRLSPVITEQNRMLIAEADLPNDGTLRPGAFARAAIVVAAAEPALAVSHEAVTAFVGLEKIFAVQDGKAIERLVTTGRRAGDQVELVKGAKAGDIVVLNPGSLQNGQPVVVESAAGVGQSSAKVQKKTSSAAKKTSAKTTETGKKSGGP